MTPWTQYKLSDKTLLFLILAVAAALRFYDLTGIPFTYDEFSALKRTHFDGFSELIEQGVKIDGHPAGIQVFLFYWTQAFGYAEWVVKLPFILFGLLSVLLVHRIAKRWFNETVALLSASYMAAIQYTVMYSQIARPYISGLFFSLAMVWFWTQVIRQPEKNFWVNLLLYVLFASLCSYNHHFSLLFAAIVGLSGLFIVRKKFIWRYILAGILIFLLYIPHLNIFFYQLGVGGVENWLAKPHFTFITDYLFFIFNYSFISLSLAVCLMVYGLFSMDRERMDHRKYLLFFSWFALPIAIGFTYSILNKSVLQFSVLIFSFPYLFFLLFGHIRPQKFRVNALIVTAVLLTSVYSLAWERHHYRLFYHPAFRQIMVDHGEAADSAIPTLSLIDMQKEISLYYCEKLGIDTHATWISDLGDTESLVAYLQEWSGEYRQVYFGCISTSDPVIVPIIRDYYPSIVWQHNYAGGTTYLFSGQPDTSDVIDRLDFDAEPGERWIYIDKKNHVISDTVSSNTAYAVDSGAEWSPAFLAKLNEIIQHDHDFIDISMNVLLTDGYEDISLVGALEDEEGTYYWSANPFSLFIPEDHAEREWATVHHSLKLSDIQLPGNDFKLRVYAWNKGKHAFMIDDFTVMLREGNPVVYGLVERFRREELSTSSSSLHSPACP